jgi:hypothetical protein
VAVATEGDRAPDHRRRHRSLVRAPTLAALCDALATPAVDAARGRGRLRIDVDPRRI